MRKGLLIFPVLVILISCGKKGSEKPVTPVLPPASPGAAILSLPAQNAVCTTGTIVSDSISTITFSWTAGSNTESYDLTLKNLLTSVSTTQNTSQTQLSVDLPRNTPFSWYIVSKSSKTSSTGQSDTWKFYNAGKGIVSYAPFPADINSPAFGEIITAATVNLSWKGNSVLNGSIANYDVYLGTSSNPSLFKSAVTDNFIDNVELTPKSTYYWKVITHDVLGNTSESGVFQFSIR